MLLEQLKTAKVAIWGFGVEGKATADYLLHRCPGLSFTVLCPAHEVPETSKEAVTFNSETVNTKVLDQ